MENQKQALWYLLQFKPNSHFLAERNLKNQGFKTFLPLVVTTKRLGKKFKNEVKPFFPGYMFVSFDPKINFWKKISHTIGVTRLVKLGGVLNPVPTELVSELKRRNVEMNKNIADQVCRGKNVRLIRGPFSDFVGVVEDVDAKKRIWVLLDILGRHSRIQVNPKDFECE